MRYQKASFIYLNEAFFCTSCGRQVEELKSSSQTAAQPNIVINNANSNNNNINSGGFAGRTGQEKNKWVAVFLQDGLVLTDSMKVKQELVYCGYVPEDLWGQKKL